MADIQSRSVTGRSRFKSTWTPKHHILATQSKCSITFNAMLGMMGSPREFMFIDSASDRKSANEAVRVHVMRESHRARRQLRGLREGTESTSHGQMTIFTSETPTDTTGQANRPGNTSGREEATSGVQSQIQLPTAETTTTSADEAQSRLTSADSSAVSQIFELIPKIKDPQAFQADLAALCGDEPAPLNALRAVAAFISADSTIGTERSNTTIIQLESQALEALQTRIANVGDPLHSDQTILTVLLLARLEHARQNTQVGAFHTSALETMLAQRGGRDVVAESNPVLALLLSVDVETLRERSPQPAEGTTASPK